MSGQIVEKVECARFHKNLDAYVDRELNKADELSFLQHADECEVCCEERRRAEALLRMLRALDEHTVMPPSGQAAWRSAVRAMSRAEKKRPSRGGVKALVSMAAALAVLVTSTAYLRSQTSASPESAQGVRDKAAYVIAEPTALRAKTTMSGDLWVGESVLTDGAADTLNGTGADSVSMAGAESQKMAIKRAERTIETYEFDENEESVRDLVSEYGGYVVNSSVSGAASDESASGRVGVLDVRVPTKQLSDFLTALSGIGETVYKRESAEDIYTDYTDADSRISSLRAQLDRLDGLMKDAASLDEILSIEARELEVQNEIEQLTAQLATYDSDLDESSVSITLTELRAKSASANDSLSTRMSTGFADSLEWCKGFLRDMAVVLAYAAPALIVVIPLLVIAVVIVRAARRRRRG